MINVGLEFTVFSGKLSGSMEYYDKKSTDLLSPDEIDPTVGMTSMTRNVGIVNGSGFDLALRSNIKAGGVGIGLNLFLSRSISRVEQYRGKVGLANLYLPNSGSTLTPLPGRALYPVFALRSSDLDPQTGDPQGVYQGEISKDYAAMLRDSLQNVIYVGTALPPYYGSFSGNLSWRGFELSLLIMYKFGHYFQKQTIRYSGLYDSWNGHSDIAKRWRQPGDEQHTTVPSMVYPAGADRDNFYAYSESNIQRGDVVRLQDIRLSYTLRPWQKRTGMRLTLFALANNVAILWKANRANLDPDYQDLPQPRRISFGLNCSF